MQNQTIAIDPSILNGEDPLPWLIRCLREKQAEQLKPSQAGTTTEPQKESL